MTLYTHAESNTRKTWLYLTGFLIFIILVGWVISYYMQSTFILWLAVILAILMSAGSYWASDKIVLAMTRAKLIKEQDNKELYRLVENLCITAGLPLPKIYIINDPSPNAFATGRDKNHAVVAVTRGLLEKLERVELEGVIAHELAHIGNKDMLLQTIIVVLVGVVVLMTDFFFRMSLFGGRRNNRENNNARVIMLLVAIALAIFAPILATLIKLAISRKREFLADASGSLLTRHPEGLARALEKISKDPYPIKRVSNATAHLFIASPFRGKQSKNWLTKMFATHPAISDRTQALRGMQV